MQVLGIFFVEIGCARSWPPGGLQRVNLGSREIGVPVGAPLRHHGVEFVVVEVGFSWSQVDGGMHGVNLGPCEIGGSWSESLGGWHGCQAIRAARVDGGVHAWRPRGHRPSHFDMEFAILSELCFREHRLPAIQRHDIRVHLEGGDGSCILRELLCDENLGSPVLIHDEQQCVPYDALQHHRLHCEIPRAGTVHGSEEGSSHHKRVGDGAQHKNGDHPIQATPLGESHPNPQTEKHEHFGHHICRYEPEVHCVWVVPGYELKG